MDMKILLVKIEKKMSVQTTTITNAVTKNVMEALDEKMKYLMEENKHLKDKVVKLERKISSLEKDKRENNIVFGLDEKEKNEWELVDRAKELIEETGVNIETLQVEKTGWSFKKCKELSEEIKIPSLLKETSQQISIAERFLTFYASGHIPNTHQVTDIVLSAAFLIYKNKAKTSGDLIWHNDLYSSKEEDCGFSVQGDTPVRVESGQASREEEESKSETEEELLKMVDLSEDQNIVFETADQRKNRETKELRKLPEEDISTLSKLTQQFLHEFKSGALKDFILEAAKILKNNPIDKGFTRAHINLIKVVNFLALTMLRRVIRTNARTLAFLKEQYKRNICSLVPCQLSLKYAPPTKACIQALDGISKNNVAISSFIAKLVTVWIEQQHLNHGASAIVSATVLTHLAWNGMGILHMIFEICNHFSASWKTIMHHTLFNTTKESWREIIAFCSTYQKREAADHSVAWARVIDDTYFMGLTIAKHINLASTLVDSLISSQGDDGVLAAKWATDHSEVIMYYQEASRKLRDILAGTDVAIVPGTDEARLLTGLIGKKSSTQRHPVVEKESSLDLGISRDDFLN